MVRCVYRGSRASKRQREAAAAAAEAAEESEKAARYELALEKANRKASTAAQRASVATGHISDDEDEEEKQLAASLAKVRAPPVATVLGSVLARLAYRRRNRSFLGLFCGVYLSLIHI